MDLDRELSETGSWMYLGLYLGLPKHKLDAIYADYGTQGLARCKLEMLESVLNCRGDTLSWDAVVEAVSLTGNNRIAKKIADKHGVLLQVVMHFLTQASLHTLASSQAAWEERKRPISVCACTPIPRKSGNPWNIYTSYH